MSWEVDCKLSLIVGRSQNSWLCQSHHRDVETFCFCKFFAEVRLVVLSNQRNDKVHVISHGRHAVETSVIKASHQSVCHFEAKVYGLRFHEILHGRS